MGFWKFIGDVLDTAIGPYPVKGSVVRSPDDRPYGIYDGYAVITTDSFGNLLRLREKDFALKFNMSGRTKMLKNLSKEIRTRSKNNNVKEIFKKILESRMATSSLDLEKQKLLPLLRD